MRVAIIAESFIPIVNGVSNSVLRVLEHLRREGHDAMVIAPRPPGWQPPAGDAPAGDAPVSSTSEPGPGDTYEGFPIHRVPAVNLPPINSLPIGVPLPRVYRLLKQFQPDVVHLASPFVLGGAGVFAAKALKVPQVAVYQTDVPGFTEHYKLTFLLNMSWRWVRAMHNNSALTLAPSSPTIEQLREHGVQRVHHWGRGVDTQRFHPAKRSTELRGQWREEGQAKRGTAAPAEPRKLVGFVGRLAAEKDVANLASLNDHEDVQLVIVGDGPDREKLEKLMPTAVFTGALYGEELAVAFASLDVFVHPGRFETFCQAIQEAQASGLPVVAPRAGGPVDLVEDGVSGFLLDPERFAEELPGPVGKIIADGALEHFAAAALTRVQGKTWPALCEQLMGYYQQAITA